MSYYLTLVLIPPNQLIAAPGSTAIFLCHSDTNEVDGIQWRVNGTPFEDLDLGPNVTPNFGGEDMVEVGRLVFTNLSLEYNMTRIECRITSIPNVWSSVTVLLIYG